MEWFRARSRGESLDKGYSTKERPFSMPPTRRIALRTSTSTINRIISPSVNVYVPTSSIDVSRPRSAISTTSGRINRTPSAATDRNPSNRATRSAAPSQTVTNIPRVHHDSVDQNMMTTGRPLEIMKHVLDVLLEMGLEIRKESHYKYRCVRPEKRKGESAGDEQDEDGREDATAVTNPPRGRINRRGPPVSSFPGAIFKRFLARRRSSRRSDSGPQPVDSRTTNSVNDESNPPLAAPRNERPPSPVGTLYGHTSQDMGGEVRFLVELIRAERWMDTYSLDIKRLKGDLKSYKFLYDSLRQRADLNSDRF